MNNILDNIVNAFVNFSVWDAFDIVVVAFLIYFLLKFLDKYNAIRLAKFIAVFITLGIFFGSSFSHMRMSRAIFSMGALVLLVIILIMFHQDIRRGLWRIASPKDSRQKDQLDKYSDEELKYTISEIVRATQNMAKKDTGALIIISTVTPPTHILQSGTMLDSKLSGALIETIFINKSPLHDGAVFVMGNKILAAGCFLPLSQTDSIPKELGTRHRAAIGVSENYDVLAIVVSEETGIISVCKKGAIEMYYDSVKLTDELEQVYGLKATKVVKKARRL